MVKAGSAFGWPELIRTRLTKWRAGRPPEAVAVETPAPAAEPANLVPGTLDEALLLATRLTNNPRDSVALAAVQASVARWPGNVALWRAIFVEALLEQRYAATSAYFVTSMSAQPSKVVLRNLKGVASLWPAHELRHLLPAFSEPASLANAHGVLAETALASGLADLARRHLDAIEGSSEAGLQIQLLRAAYSVAVGEFDEARRIVESVLLNENIDFASLSKAFDIAQQSGDAQLQGVIAQRMLGVASGKTLIRTAQCLVLAGDRERAYEILESLQGDPALSKAAGFWLAHYLRFEGRFEDASAVLATLLSSHPQDAKGLLELSELHVEHGRYDDCVSTTSMARVQLGPDKAVFSTAEFSALCSLGRYREAFDGYKNRGSHRQLRYGALGERYTPSFERWRSSPERLVCAVSGVGDEIRWSSTYGALPRGTAVTCDPRLVGLFERSFPHLTFLPVKRRYKAVDLVAGPAYADVPHPELTYFFDSHGWNAALGYPTVTTMYDIMGDLRPDEASFAASAGVLKPDERRVEACRQRLGEGRHIAISWGSELSSYARNHHGTPFEVICALASRLDGTLHILQGRVGDDDRAALARASGGRVRFPADDIDMRNDFEEFAALLSAMDVTIASATSTVELAGSLGGPVVLTSRSRLVHWRIRGGRDIWFSNIRHAHSPMIEDVDGMGLLDRIESALNER